MKQNEDSLDTPKCKRTFNYQDDSAALLSRKVQKIVPENSELATDYLNEDSKREEARLPVKDIMRIDMDTMVGRVKIKAFNCK